jgi:hypothetical protein
LAGVLTRPTTTRLRPGSLQATKRSRTLLNRLKQFRDLATRYAKRTAYHHANLTIAAIILWLR